MKFCGVFGAAWFVKKHPSKLENPAWGRTGLTWCVAEHSLSFQELQKYKSLFVIPKGILLAPTTASVTGVALGKSVTTLEIAPG